MYLSALLSTMGGKTLRKAKESVQTDIYPFEEMFDGFCIIIGALLLIFPGFISDFLALPLLVPPVRHWIFVFLKYKHAAVFDDLNKRSRGFTYWYYEERGSDGSIKTIEGDFKSTDEDKRLN